eukprot:Gb_40021 [translate_table: standard]
MSSKLPVADLTTCYDVDTNVLHDTIQDFFNADSSSDDSDSGKGGERKIVSEMETLCLRLKVENSRKDDVLRDGNGQKARIQMALIPIGADLEISLVEKACGSSSTNGSITIAYAKFTHPSP